MAPPLSFTSNQGSSEPPHRPAPGREEGRKRDHSSNWAQSLPSHPSEPPRVPPLANNTTAPLTLVPACLFTTAVWRGFAATQLHPPKAWCWQGASSPCSSAGGLPGSPSSSRLGHSEGHRPGPAGMGAAGKIPTTLAPQGGQARQLLTAPQQRQSLDSVGRGPHSSGSFSKK